MDRFNRHQCDRAFNHYCQQRKLFLIKVVLLGDAGVGKSSLWTRLGCNMFNYTPPLAIHFFTRTTNIKGNDVKFYVFDTFDQERFGCLTRSYYRNAVGALLVYDITNRKSFEHAQYWLEQIREYGCTETTIILVGNKGDLHSRREVTSEEASIFADKNGISFIETSALTSHNVDDAFENLSKEIDFSKNLLDDKCTFPTRSTTGSPTGTDYRSLCCCIIFVIGLITFLFYT